MTGIILEHCPFCGGKAELYTGTQVCRTREYLANVKCTECGCSMNVVSDPDPEEAARIAIERWNERADRAKVVVPMEHQ